MVRFAERADCNVAIVPDAVPRIADFLVSSFFVEYNNSLNAADEVFAQSQ